MIKFIHAKREMVTASEYFMVFCPCDRDGVFIHAKDGELSGAAAATRRNRFFSVAETCLTTGSRSTSRTIADTWRRADTWRSLLHHRRADTWRSLLRLPPSLPRLSSLSHRLSRQRHLPLPRQLRHHSSSAVILELPHSSSFRLGLPHSYAVTKRNSPHGRTSMILLRMLHDSCEYPSPLPSSPPP